MYSFVESLKLNLGLGVPADYIETIFDCITQLAIGLEFAHSQGLIHGKLELQNVLIQSDGTKGNVVYKINNFRPGSTRDAPLSSELNSWSFAKGNKRPFTEGEKVEILMLKDIYSLGICILELMIGRFSENRYSITIDSLPLTWAEYPESTPLIQVLVECLNIDSISQRKGKL